MRINGLNLKKTWGRLHKEENIAFNVSGLGQVILIPEVPDPKPQCPNRSTRF